MSVITPPPTDRLQFRPYKEDDLAAVIEMFDDSEARRWYPRTSEPDQAGGWIRWNLDNYNTTGFGLWVIERQTTNAFLGDCGLTYQSVDGQRLLEVGYHLQARHRGHGYAAEAARACSAYAFDELTASMVCSIVDPQNGASIRVAAGIHSSDRTFINDNGKEMYLYWTTGVEPDRLRTTARR